MPQSVSAVGLAPRGVIPQNNSTLECPFCNTVVLAAEMATFDAKSAHVVRLEPFASHTQDVDAGVRAITVIFDKPLDTKACYSINYGAGGKEHYPITGQPAFEPGGERLVLPVDLKPNQTYSFVLTPRAFVMTDGYPLVSYTVEFRTK